MSSLVNRSDYDNGEHVRLYHTFSLGDRVSFNGPYGDRMTGEIVRVYNIRTVYHVEVDGERYSVRTDFGNQDDVRSA